MTVSAKKPIFNYFQNDMQRPPMKFLHPRPRIGGHNQLRIGHNQHTFPRLTNTNQLQAKALDLLDVKLSK